MGIALVLVAAGAFGLWRYGQSRAAVTDEQLRQEIQNVLDLEQQAVLAGDGDLFLSLRSAEPAWLSAALQPAYRDALAAGYQVSRAEQHGDFLWASLTWNSDGREYQRAAFFRRQAGQLLHAPGDPAYWGAWQESRFAWGKLVYTTADAVWADEIGGFIQERVAGRCPPDCPVAGQTVTVTIAPDTSLTALANHLRLPSPRLIALDGESRPGAPFWQRLEEELEGYLTPGTVRFGVPEHIHGRYSRLAASSWRFTRVLESRSSPSTFRPASWLRCWQRPGSTPLPGRRRRRSWLPAWRWT
jgi:hypothetical protein